MSRTPVAKHPAKHRNYDSAYLVTKWLSKEILKSKIEDVKTMSFGPKERKEGWFSVFQSALLGPSAEEERIRVIQYWEHSVNDTKGLNDRTMKAILILQATFRSWLILHKLRQQLRINVSSNDKVLVAQCAVRRWKAKRLAHDKASEKMTEEKAFKTFCKRMMEGCDVTMFGRKYGNAELRKLRFDSSMTNLIYCAGSSLNVRKVPLSRIYGVNKGLSGYPYLTRPTHRSWCFHLCVLGNRYIDIEAHSAEDYRQLVRGFTRMHLLSYTAAPFFVDQNGIPCRADESVIKNALRNDGVGEKGCRSEADLMRYRNAIKALKQEYDMWDFKEEEERRAFDERVQATRALQLDETKTVSKSATAAGDEMKEPEENDDFIDDEDD